MSGWGMRLKRFHGPSQCKCASQNMGLPERHTINTQNNPQLTRSIHVRGFPLGLRRQGTQLQLEHIP